jgi:single-stranded-DNA-specific exonuclease
VNRTNADYVEYVSRLASVSFPFAQILINRGLRSSAQIRAFLDPSLSSLSDPFELPGVAAAAARILRARTLGERVLVHGDYDADGVSATALMVEGLRALDIETSYFIPHRIEHGYGLGPAGVRRAREVGAGLIVTVDCGITSFEAVETAKSLGIDVVITDHHEPLRKPKDGSPTPFGDTAASLEEVPREGEPVLPGAVAVVNPKLLPRSAVLMGAEQLSGAGVAFKVVQALFDGRVEPVQGMLDLAAIGTGADVVSLLGDNRVILREGLGLIRSAERPGIRALKDASGLRPDFFRTSLLYYVLIPRINAAGRIADATDVVRLLTTRSDAEAEELARTLNDLNTRRQGIEESVYREALRLMESADRLTGAIVLAQEGWHQGVVGIVASKIAEQYGRPTFVLSIQDGVARGSGRSIPAFDILEGLTLCKDVLRRFGGHRQAAGLSLDASDILRFTEMIASLARERLTDDDLVPTLVIDAAVKISDVNYGLIEELALLEPCGYGNEEPLLGARGLEVLQPRVVGNNHLKMSLRQGSHTIDSIGFDFGGFFSQAEGQTLVDAAFLPMFNEWNGSRRLQLNVKALRPAAP